jgi:glycogen operon protein
MLATLMLAQGTPMLNAGDEIGNSQGGNNNAYCQDNPTGWLDWAGADRGLVRLVGQLAELRRQEPLLRHGRWFACGPGRAGDASLSWSTPAGTAMQLHDWQEPTGMAFACHIVANDPAAASILLLFNPGAAPQPFTLPPGAWKLLLDSSGSLPPTHASAASAHLTAPSRSLLVLRSH